MESKLQRELCRPVVACVVTEEADKSCLVNGLSFEQLMAPFTWLPGAKLPFRSASGVIVLENLGLKMVRASNMAPPPPGTSDPCLASAMALGAEEASSMLDDAPRIRDSYDVPSALEKHSISRRPWFGRYRSELERTLQWREYTMLECPAAVVLVASTAEGSGDPVACLEELQHQRYLPPPFHLGQFDTSGVAFHFVLLHDQCKAAAARVDVNAVISRARQAVPGQQLSIVTINSLPPLSPNLAQPDIWLPACGDVLTRDCESNGMGSPMARGCFLSPDNIMELSQFARELASGTVLRSMERRISNLNTIVSTVQNRVKNLVKSWWRKPKEGGGGNDAPVSKQGVLYRYDRIESQIRLLADSTFVMQDFDFAYGMYRMVAAYFKSDRSMLHYALAARGAAVCAILTNVEGSRRRDIESNLTTAADACERKATEDRMLTLRSPESSNSPPPIPLATRIGSSIAFLRADALGMHVMDLEAAEALTRASRHESSLTAGVLMEKAAWHLLRARSLRKYALHMVMAGRMYRASEKHVHAARCYVCALGIYEGSGWRAIQAHVHSVLADELAALGRHQPALQFFARLLVDAEGVQQAPSIESGYMSAFLDLCSKYPAAAKAAGRAWAKGSGRGWVELTQAVEVGAESTSGAPTSNASSPQILFPELPVPRVLDEDLEVLGEGAQAQRGERGVELKALKDALRAEVMAVDAVGRGEGPWLDVSVSIPYKMRRDESYLDRQRKVARPTAKWHPLLEPILVKVMLENPLTVPLALSNVHLTALLRPCDAPESVTLDAPDAAGADVYDAVVLGGGSFEADMSVAAAAGSDAWAILESLSFTLPPRSKEVVHLRVCPIRRGLLHITGLRWNLGGAEDQVPVLMGQHAFELKGPLLQDSRDHRAMRLRAPQPALHAAVVCAMPCLKCTLSGLPPSLLQGEIIQIQLQIENVGHADAEGIMIKSNMPCISLAGHPCSTSDSNLPSGGALGASGTVFYPLLGTIAPGKSAQVSLWLKGRSSGQQALTLLVRYKRPVEENLASAPKSVLNFERFVPVSTDFCVLPSLSVSASVLPSYSARGEYVLRLELTNQMANGADHLNPGQSVINVKGVFMASQHWRLESMVSSCGESADHPLPCRWQERVCIHFRLFPLLNRRVSGSESHSAPFLQPVLGHGDGNGGPAVALPHVELLCLEHAAAKFATAEERYRQQLVAEEAAASDDQPMTIQAIRRQNERHRTLEVLKHEEEERKRQWDEEHHPHPASPAALCPPDSSLLTLVVLWSASGRDMHVGQHHIRSLVIRPPTAERQCPLVLTAKYPRMLHECGELDVEVCVTNRLTGKDSAVDFSFEVRQDDAPQATLASGGRAGSESPGNGSFSWLGPTRKIVERLGPGQSTVIPLRAVFLRPGVYDLNCFRFTVGPTTFVFPAQYLVDVKDHVEKKSSFALP